ncbi:Mth938-like domain-containing protein [Lysobacter sp. CA199]|uniref:Mth938-like domain-containing protein n=1 Tax=Lysobacter sp. CA199 TaxID=3455608 RepID=UPI003F8D006B
MLLTLENPDHEFFLRGADGQAALVNQRRLERSFILAPNQLIEDWAVGGARTLSIEELEPLFALEPELIVLGCGATQAFPPAATLAACLRRGVGLESMTNAAAARTFNVLAGEGRRVVAGFVLGA